MTEEAARSEDESATPLHRTSAYLTQILGAVEAPGSKVQGEGAGNSTRWVFDLEGEAGATIEVYLLDPRNRQRRVKPDLMSYSLSALTPSFYDARPVAAYDADTGVFRITSQKRGEALFACRVAIDVMHSATR